MAAKRVLLGEAGRTRLLAGARLLARAVRPTLGPGGRNVLLQRPNYAAPLVTRDGVTVAEEIELADSFANMGAQLVIEGAAKTALVAGDGTTTAVLLAHALYREGAKLIAAGHHPVELVRGMQRAVDRVVEGIRRLARPLVSDDELRVVAILSAAGDAAIGDLVARAVERVGREGIIHVEQGTALETKLEVAEGTDVTRGFLSPYFITDPDRMVAALERPLVFLCEQKITRAQELVPLVEKVAATGRSLLVVGEIQGDALSLLVVNKLKGVLKVCALLPPSHGDKRKEMLRDLAAQTGGRALLEDTGLTVRDVVMSDLGQAERVVVDRERTTIIGGAGRKEEIEGRAREIRARYQATESAFDHQELDERLRKLVGGAAVLRVGGTTDAEVRERKLRLEDALFAARAAIEDGIVPGGGVALLRASARLVRLERSMRPSEAAGVAIVRRACEEPCRRIAENVGKDGAVIVAQIRAGKAGFGFDARRDRLHDLVAAGVVDPAKVVRLALENAASVAMLLLSTEAFVVDAPRAPVDYPTVGGTGHDALSLEPFLSRR